MKERLIIISDLWGKEKAEWLHNYTKILDTKFNIKYYDSCEIGNINKTIYTEDNLHKQFVNGGIENAVEKLLELEKKSTHILAFSIGGTIAWKFALKSRKNIFLTCVSSTRLRKETEKPKGKLTLYYGEKDVFRPKRNWIKNMNLACNIIPDKNHQFYKENKFAKELSEKL